jgi:hypothetical protein
MTDRVLATLSPEFTRMYSTIGRPSIAPEKLLRTLLLLVRSCRSDASAAAISSLRATSGASRICRRNWFSMS